MFSQATLERSETETRQRLTAQVEKQEREISQLQKKLEHEVEQKHVLGRNHDVSTLYQFSVVCAVSLDCLKGKHKPEYNIPIQHVCAELRQRLNLAAWCSMTSTMALTEI